MKRTDFYSLSNKRVIRPLLAFLLSASTAAVSAAQTKAQPKPASTLAFVHVNVVPMNREVVLEDQTVVVLGGKIQSIGPSLTNPIPAGARTIEARGKYLI